MNLRTLALGLSLAVLPVVSPAARAQSGAGLQPVDRIVAVVDEDVILQSELERAVRNILAQYAGKGDQLPPEDVLRKQVLERLVLTRLQVARAESSGIKVSDEDLDQAYASVAQQNNLSPEQLRAQLAGEGISYAQFRDTLRDELLTQRLRQSFAQSRISVSEGEVDAAMKSQAAGGVEYHLAHILVALPEGATPEQVATGQKKIDGVKGLLDKGEMTFAAAAARYSDSPNALEGGDLGWRPQDQIPPAFAQTIGGMQPGQVIGPVRGTSGFQLIQMIESRQGSSASGQDRRTEVRNAIGQRKLEDEWNRFLREMRGEAYVDIRLASPAAGG